MKNEDLNIEYLKLFIDPITRGLDEKSLNIGRLFIEYDHPIFPPSWLEDIPIILFEEGKNDNFTLWLNSIGKIIAFLKNKGLLMGAVKQEEDVLVPFDIHRYLFNIGGYKGAKTLEELNKQQEEGLIKIWTPYSFGKEILMNLYGLFNKLENKDKYRFLNRINPYILLTKEGVELKEYTTKIKSSIALNISFKEEGEVLINNKELNKYCWIYPERYKTSFILWVILLGLPIKVTITQTLGLIIANTLKGLWKEEYSYGVKPNGDSVVHCLHSHIIKPLEYQFKEDVFPPLLFKPANTTSPTGNPSSSDSLQYLIDEGYACTPHKYAKYNDYSIFGPGAEAMGIGLRVNEDGSKDILSINIDIKSREGAKLFNRPTSNWKSTTAEGSEDMPLQPSHLKMGTSIGAKKYYGIPLIAAITNSRLGHGSGVASIHPDKKISYKLYKSVEGEIPFYLIPPEEKKKIRANGGFGDSLLTHLIEPIKKKLKSKVGKAFNPNETILELWTKYPKYHTHIIKAPNLNLSFNLSSINDDNFEVIKYSRNESSLKVSLNLETNIEDSEVKVRVPGGKFTTIPDEIIFKDDRYWDLFIPYEGIKGRLLMLTSFANFIWNEYKVDSTYISNEGRLVFDNPISIYNQEVLSIDLTTTHNIFEDWVKENTQLIWVEREISKHILDYLYKDNPGMVQLLGEYKPNADIKVIEEIPNGYRIEEYVQCLMGEIYINVEITSPREYLNTQGLTLEQLVILETLSPKLAKALNNRSIGTHLAVKTFIDFSEGKYLSKEDKEIPRYTSQELSAFLKENLDIESIRKEGNLLRECDRLLPKGVIIKDSTGKGLFVHFGIIFHYGEVSEGGTKTKGLASSLSYLIRVLMEDTHDEKLIVTLGEKIRIDSYLWFQRMQGMKKGRSKILKRLGRTDKVAVGIKIKTSHQPEVEHQDGLPVFLIHPECESIKYLQLKDGDYIAVGRNPMSSLAFGIAIISPKAHIGHLRCSPIVWDVAVAGDSDGDPSFILNLSNLNLEVTKEEMRLWNSSLLMMGNNQFLKDDNFKGFVSPKSKWVTKVIDSSKGIPNYQPDTLDPITTIIPSPEFINKSKRVASHYTYNVGNGYGIFSLLSFWCGNQIANIRKENEGLDIYEMNKVINDNSFIINLQKAVILASRILYEAKGLGGYSKDRSEVFEVLQAVSFQEDGSILKVYKDGEWIYAPYKNMSKYNSYTLDIVDGRKLLAQMLIEEDTDKNKDVISLIIQSNALRLTFSSLERGTGIPYDNSLIDNAWPNTQQRAAIYGSLRRLGQGSFNEGVSGLSLPQIVGSLGEQVIGNFIKSEIILYYLTQNVPYLAQVHNKYKKTFQ